MIGGFADSDSTTHQERRDQEVIQRMSKAEVKRIKLRIRNLPKDSTKLEDLKEINEELVNKADELIE
jgi:hypothetical protein